MPKLPDYLHLTSSVLASAVMWKLALAGVSYKMEIVRPRRKCAIYLIRIFQ